MSKYTLSKGLASSWPSWVSRGVPAVNMAGYFLESHRKNLGTPIFVGSGYNKTGEMRRNVVAALTLEVPA